MVVFGVLNFALPRAGYDLRWFEALGSARDPLAIGLLVVGTLLLLLSRRKKRP
jgi:hypothetical protein